MKLLRGDCMPKTWGHRGCARQCAALWMRSYWMRAAAGRGATGRFGRHACTVRCSQLETYRLFQRAPMVAGVAGNQDRKIFKRRSETSRRTGRWHSWWRLSGRGADRLAASASVDGRRGRRALPVSRHAVERHDLSAGRCEFGSAGGSSRRAEILELLGGVREPVILCGHSHIPRVVRLSNGQMIVNPGSVGLAGLR